SGILTEGAEKIITKEDISAFAGAGADIAVVWAAASSVVYRAAITVALQSGRSGRATAAAAI
ncbi:MAG: hypothetical protein IJB55_03600, partial [Firmicutes bacterium]|nr:hypothetical protein [Bacillota bacterium]